MLVSPVPLPVKPPVKFTPFSLLVKITVGNWASASVPLIWLAETPPETLAALPALGAYSA